MKIYLLLSVMLGLACSSRIVWTERKGVPTGSGWMMQERADKDLMVSFTVSLPRQNLYELEKRFWEISDPKSNQYTKFMSRNEVLDLISPSSDVNQKVMDWIKSEAGKVPNSRLKLVDQRDGIDVTASVRLIEKLFETEMFMFQHKTTEFQVAKHFGKLTIPEDLADYIVYISGITELHRVPKSMEFKMDQLPFSWCNVPWSMKNLYSIPQDLTVNNSYASAGIYAALQMNNQGFGVNDMSLWQQANGYPQNPVSCLMGSGLDYYGVLSTDGEALLDVQMISGMAPGTDLCWYLMGPNQGWMLGFARFVFASPNAPLILSISYGDFEFNMCNDTNCSYYHIANWEAYINVTNVEFIKLGSVGTSVLAASGDDGAVGGHESPDHCELMFTSFPATSPYVTAVGATWIAPSNSDKDTKDGANLPPMCTTGPNPSLQCNCTTSTNEQIATLVPFGRGNHSWSGGGFSIFNTRPAYQDNAVLGYFKTVQTLPDPKYWNKNNRGYPDIAAMGIVGNVANGSLSPQGGTSASCPIIAGIFNLLNNDRLNAGKGPLGFLNQLIYSMYDENATKYFNNNFNVNVNSGECDPSLGFYSSPGHWSPMSGVGSVKFDAIREYVSQLP